MPGENLASLRELYESGQLQAAWHLYLETPSQDAAWHNLGAKAAYFMDRMHSARTAAQRALECQPSGDQTAQAHLMLGVTNRRIGDLTVAREHFEACLAALDGAETLGPILRGPCLYDYALALCHAGFPHEAYEANESALLEFEQESLVEYRRMALLNASWYAADLRNAGRAGAALDEAEPLCRTGAAFYQHRFALCYLAYRQEMYHAAATLAQEILSAWEGALDVPAELVAIVAAIMADVGLHEGSVASAVGLSSLAYDLTWRVPEDQRAMTFVARILTKVNKAKKGA